jgi:hypothetical protein
VSGWTGYPYSGRNTPIGGIQILADPNNSGSIYVSLSGGNQYSGQIGTLVGSGGSTITSGIFSGGAVVGGLMDGMRIGPGVAYFIPAIGIPNRGYNSGVFNVCVGADPACSGGFSRVFFEVF